MPLNLFAEAMIERCVYLRGAEIVGKFWHNLILTFRGGTDLKGAIVSYHPEDPITFFNHAADINVSEDEADNLLNRITKCFSSGGFSICLLSNFPANSSEIVRFFS